MIADALAAMIGRGRGGRPVLGKVRIPPPLSVLLAALALGAHAGLAAAASWDGDWGSAKGPNYIEITGDAIIYSANGQKLPVAQVQISANRVMFQSGSATVTLDRLGPKTAKFASSDRPGTKELCNGPCALATAADLTVYAVKPSDADPTVHAYDDPNYVIFAPASIAMPQLVVYLPGTDGTPEDAALLMTTVANQGYRVIGLMYDDHPSVVQACPQTPNPFCSGDFREKRIFGDGARTVIDNPLNEAIVTRLVNLIRYLDQQHPDDKWSAYLGADGQPDWSHIVIAGLSQGAGMAAYIAQRRPVARVVLFSSPWDYLGKLSAKKLAPWISGASVTPPQRWFAEYNARENTAALIAQAYATLHIPDANQRVFRLDLRPGVPASADNPYHGDTQDNPGYTQDWQFLFGRSP